MSVQIERAAGARYLELVTAVLQRARRADPRAGAWEAADLQWWSTRDPHDDPDDAEFFLDDDGPLAASVLTRWPRPPISCDVLGPAGFEPAWAALAEQLAAQPADADVEMCVLAEAEPAARRLGFTEPTESSWAT